MTRSVHRSAPVAPPFWRGLLWGTALGAPLWLLIALAAHAVWQAWR